MSATVESLYRFPWSKTDNPGAWIEVTDECDLDCPGCYRHRLEGHRPLDELKQDVLALRPAGLPVRARLHREALTRLRQRLLADAMLRRCLRQRLLADAVLGLCRQLRAGHALATGRETLRLADATRSGAVLAACRPCLT